MKAPCYRLGLWFTIVIFVIDIFTIIASISNCIVYAKIVSGEPNNDISLGWGRFMLGVNVLIAIVSFVVFFWIIYIWVAGKEKTIGTALDKYGNVIADYTKQKMTSYGDPEAHQTISIEAFKKLYDGSGKDFAKEYPTLAAVNSCSDGNPNFDCRRPQYGGDANDAFLNTIFQQNRQMFNV
jgi:hypothetical protein